LHQKHRALTNNRNDNKTSEAKISKEVLYALREGDHSAFDKVYLCFVSPITDFLTVLLRCRETAEEIAQETFVVLWEKRENIDPDKNISGYLFTIAKNFALKRLNKNKMISSSEGFPIQENHSLAIAPDEIFIGKETEILIEILIRKMPAQRRRIFEFNRKEGLTNDEIARRLNISKNTVENHVTIALKDLRKGL